MSKAPKTSSTFEKVTQLDTSSSEPAPAPAQTRSVPPPLRHTASRRPSTPSLAPLSSLVSGTGTGTGRGEAKSTIALGDADLEPLSALSSQREFSIRRGVVLGGRFRVTQLIGAGAQCFVYAAEHTTLKSPVAIKCLQPELVTAELVERFAREAQALTAIRNAHVAAVLDVGRAPCGTPFIVMEYLQGRDLSALLEARPRLEPRHATEILLQTCEGLAAAHALGLVHQDIKPSNIFLSDEMGLVKAKVVDFGVARVSMGRTHSLGPRFTRSKLDDTVGGTPFYMPPEQFFADSVIDPRSDIFSLGMVLYEMLRGTSAFDLEMSTRRPGEPVRIERSGIDAGLANVIERCLAQDPQARFESVAELAVALLPYAPSRSRAHAEAAAALLRKAGLSVASTLPSSIPPPPHKSQLPTISIPPPAPLPTITPPRRSRGRLYAALGGAALLALGVGAWRFAVMSAAADRASEKTAAQLAAGAGSSVTVTGGAPAPVIEIHPAQRSSAVAAEAPDGADRAVAPGSAVPGASARGAVGGGGMGADAAALSASKLGAGAPKPNGPARGGAGAGAAAAAGAPPAAGLPGAKATGSATSSAGAAPPKPAGTSEDLGF